MSRATCAHRRRLVRGAWMVLAVTLLLARPGTSTAAQHDPQPFDPFASGTSIAFNRRSIAEGMSFAAVRSLLQDRRGFMWFGTVVGLNRYDGYTFWTYGPDPKVPDSLQSTTISALAQDPYGMVWIGSFDHGLAAYDPRSEHFTQYVRNPEDPSSLSADNIRSLFVDASGVLWVGTWGGGLNRRDPRTGTFTRFRHDPADPASLSDDRVLAVRESRDGMLWVATYGGLNRLDPRTGTFTRFRHDPADPASLSDDRVRVVSEDQSGRLWIGTFGGGLNRLDPRTGTFTRFRHDAADPASLADDRVTALHQDRAGRLWVGTFGGLNLLDQRTGTFTHWVNDRDDPRSLPHNNINAIAEDQSGLLWIATEGGGVASFDLYARSFQLYASRSGSPEGLSHDVIRGMARARDGTFWIGTFGGGLNHLDPRTGTFTHFRHDPADPASLSDDLIWSVYVDRNDAVWVGTEHGMLNRLDPATGRFKRFRPAYADGATYPIHEVYEDGAGELWIGSNGGSLSRFDRASERFTTYPHKPADASSLGDAYVTTIYEDRAGTLWVGTFGGGLSRFDRASERFTTYRHDPANTSSLSNDLVTGITTDRDGRLWVGTSAGLNRFDPATEGFSHVTERDGLQSNLVSGITEADGNLWLSSQRGLSRLDPHTMAIRNFGVADGLLAGGFTVGSLTPGAGGLVAAGGYGGVVVFDPSTVKEASPIPPIVFNEIYVNNQPVTVGGASPLKQALNESDTLVLPAGSRNISLDIAALDYRAPALQRYRYRLDGVDTEWNEGGARRRFVDYHDLGPGTYVLHASGTNLDGLWNETGRTLTITILPYWWQTLWFQGAALLLIGLVVSGAIGLRFRNIQIRKRQLEQEVVNRTHDLEAQTYELERTNAQLATTSAQFRQAAAAARQSRDEFETLLVISNEIISTHDIDALLNVLLEHLSRAIANDSAYIATLDGNSLTILAFRTRIGLPDMRGRTIDPGRVPAIQHLVDTGKPILVDDLHLDSQALRYAEELLGKPIVNLAWIAVPLIANQRVIGLLTLMHHATGIYGQVDLQRVQAYANQIAIAIQNARLYERDRQAAVLEERNRLARELHDAVTQTLFSTSLIADGLPNYWKNAPPKAKYGVEQLGTLTRTALAEMRSLLLELRPTALTEKPLGDVLAWLCTATSGRSGIPIRLEVLGASQLQPEAQVALYRLTQEALNNVVKHADASEARVTLACRLEKITLTIADDGRGFDVNEGSPESLGLRIMNERAAEIGATLQITSRIGNGTVVAVEWRPACRETRRSHRPAGASEGRSVPASAGRTSDSIISEEAG